MSASYEKIMRQAARPRRRRNVEGFRDSYGTFHPIRASKDYNEFLTSDVDSATDRRKRKQKRADLETAEYNWQEHQRQKAAIKEYTRRPYKKRGTVRSLSQFVRARGGMTPGGNFAGEVKRLGYKETGTTGLINQHARQGSHKQTPEYVMDAANVEGYGPFDSIGEFILAVEADAVGHRKYYTREDYDTMADL